MKKKAPSVQAVIDFENGKKDSWKALLGTFLGRAAILSASLALFDTKKDAVKRGLITSATIEAYLLWYFSTSQKKSPSA
jgi:hypothetical protein